MIDEDLYELGPPRYPGKTASLNDDRRPPLYWVSKKGPDSRGHVLMYECRHFVANECEQLPILLESIYDLLVNAIDAYGEIPDKKQDAFENIGYIDDQWKSSSHYELRALTSRRAMASESGTTGGRTKNPSAADIITGYGFDPNMLATPNGELVNPYEVCQADQSSDSDGGSFSSAKRAL